MHGAHATLNAVLKLCGSELQDICRSENVAEWLDIAISKMEAHKRGYNTAVKEGVLNLCRAEHIVLLNIKDYDFDFKYLSKQWKMYLYRNHVTDIKHIDNRRVRDTDLRADVVRDVLGLLKAMEASDPVTMQEDKRKYHYQFEYKRKM